MGENKKKPIVKFSVEIVTPEGIKVFERNGDIKDIFIFPNEAIDFVNKWKGIFELNNWNPLKEARKKYKIYKKQRKKGG